MIHPTALSIPFHFTFWGLDPACWVLAFMGLWIPDWLGRLCQVFFLTAIMMSLLGQGRMMRGLKLLIPQNFGAPQDHLAQRKCLYLDQIILKDSTS